MRGIIIVEKETGRQWLYLPEAHIRLLALENGAKEMIVAPLRTDGYRQISGGLIPEEQYLRANFNFTAELDVPQHIVDFAVESERQVRESIDAIAEILSTAVEKKNQRAGWEAFRVHLVREQLGGQRGTEHQISVEVQKLMAEARGQQ